MNEFITRFEAYYNFLLLYTRSRREAGGWGEVERGKGDEEVGLPAYFERQICGEYGTPLVVEGKPTALVNGCEAYSN
ncbi:hypothetical protein SLE2022_311250 [Rubroshorea leprosula]